MNGSVFSAQLAAKIADNKANALARSVVVEMQKRQLQQNAQQQQQPAPPQRSQSAEQKFDAEIKLGLDQALHDVAASSTATLIKAKEVIQKMQADDDAAGSEKDLDEEMPAVEEQEEPKPASGGALEASSTSQLPLQIPQQSMQLSTALSQLPATASIAASSAAASSSPSVGGIAMAMIGLNHVDTAAPIATQGAEGSRSQSTCDSVKSNVGESADGEETKESGPADPTAAATASAPLASGAPTPGSGPPQAPATLTTPPGDSSSSSSPSSSSSDSSRVAELLLYYRALSDHVVREGTAGWDHAGFGGVLMTEWQPDELRFHRPFSLLWLSDEMASTKRNDDQGLPSHLKSLPLLPYWTFGLEGDGDCLMRALVLGDVAGPTQQAPVYKPIWDSMLSLPRDPLWGKVQSQGKALEDIALGRYRQAFANHRSTSVCPTSSSLIRQLSTPKCMPPIDGTLTHANLFHQQHVCSARFDLMHESWLWDRTFPRGVIVLDSSPMDGLIQEQPQLNHEQTQTLSPRTIVLQFLEGIRALPQLATKSSAAASGHGSPTCGHTDVLIPAPDQLLCSPSHPLFPMEPAVWIPFAAVEDVNHFITPYHRGLFGTRYAHATPGSISLSSIPRDSLFTPNDGDGPFLGAVYYGSVVSCTITGSGVDEQLQGAVVLTYVKHHHRQGSKWLHSMATNVLGESPVPAVVAAAFDAMPEHGPVPYLAIWPLLQQSSGSSASSSSAATTTCWQQLAPDGSALRHIRSSEVTRVFKATELGALATLKCKRVPDLVHRACLESDPLQLDNPAQPTHLRKALSQPHVQQAVEEFVRTSVVLQDSENAGRDFLLAIRQRAQAGFPVSQLLTARAVINCAQPLPLPGRYSNPATIASAAASPAASPAPKSQAAAAASPASKAPAAAASKRPIEETTSLPNARSRPQERDAAAAARQAIQRGEDGIEESRTGKSRSRSKHGAAAASTDSLHKAPKRGSGTRQTSPAPSSSSGASSTVEKRAKSLFMELADPMQPECLAPLSGTVWNSWMTDTQYNATLGGPNLAAALDAWKEEVWMQLEDIDAQLYHFVLDQAKVSSTVEQAVALLAQGGSKPSWRRSYKEWKAPSRDVKLVWTYTKGTQPNAKHGSIFAMHCNGVWHGQRIDSGYAVDHFSTASTSDAAAAAAAAGPSTKSKRKGKPTSAASSVGTADKKSEEEDAEANGEDEEEEEEPQAERDVTDLTTSPLSKRQKRFARPTHATFSQSTALVAPRTVPPPAAAAAAAAVAPSAAAAAAPSRRTAAAAAAPATSKSAASTITPLASAPAPSSETSSIAVVMQAMQAQTAAFLAAQQRNEERSETAHRQATEAHREMLRLAQSTQQNLMDFVQTVAHGSSANYAPQRMLPARSSNLQQLYAPQSQQLVVPQRNAAMQMRDNGDSDSEMDLQAPAVGFNSGLGFGMQPIGFGSMMMSQQNPMMNQMQQQMMQQQMMQQQMMQQMSNQFMQQQGGRNRRGGGNGGGAGRSRRNGRGGNGGNSGLGGGMGGTGMGFGN